jgi:hypothetical protein
VRVVGVLQVLCHLRSQIERIGGASRAYTATVQMDLSGRRKELYGAHTPFRTSKAYKLDSNA